jgi:hypothetical protein
VPRILPNLIEGMLDLLPGARLHDEELFVDCRGKVSQPECLVFDVPLQMDRPTLVEKVEGLIASLTNEVDEKSMAAFMVLVVVGMPLSSDTADPSRNRRIPRVKRRTSSYIIDCRITFVEKLEVPRRDPRKRPRPRMEMLVFFTHAVRGE